MYKVTAIIRKVWGDTHKYEWKAESHDELVKVKGVIDHLTIHGKTAKLVSMTVIPNMIALDDRGPGKSGNS